MTKRLIIIAFLFSAMTPLLAQKTITYDLYAINIIAHLLRENRVVLPVNRSIIAQKSFSTEGSSFEKIQLQLDKKTSVSIFNFPTTFVIDSQKKSYADGRTVVKYLSLFGHFDTDRGAGGGLTLTY
jgi:hypothetical protein